MRRTHRKGTNLIEILIIAAIILILGVIVTGRFNGTLDGTNIHDDARRHLVQLGYTIEGLTCANTDSDNDGYVSCTARVKEMPTPYAFECGTGWYGTGGCRQPKPSTYRW